MIARSLLPTTTAVNAGATITVERAPSTNSESATNRKLRVKDHVLLDCNLQYNVATNYQLYIVTNTIPIQSLILINQLAYNLVCTLLSCTPIILTLLFSSMFTFIALERVHDRIIQLAIGGWHSLSTISVISMNGMENFPSQHRLRTAYEHSQWLITAQLPQ
jgi:hypothetical protein